MFFGVMWVNFCYYLFRLLETFVGIAMFSKVFGCLLDEFEKFVVWKKTITNGLFVCGFDCRVVANYKRKH